MADLNAGANATGRGCRQRTGLVARVSSLIAVTIVAAAVSLAATTSSPAAARTFTWAAKGDALTLDPHGANEAVTLGLLGNVYEGLTRYDEHLALQPALAVSWQRTAPTTWVFALRRGVRFHNGDPFTAADVVFSWLRASADDSEVRVYARKATAIRTIDDYTVEIETPVPNILLPRDLAFVYVMDEAWTRAHHAEAAVGIAAKRPANFAGLNANGTGPFRVVERQGQLKTTLARFGDYWQATPGNVDTAILTPIPFDSTRLAAILSGSVDAIGEVPIQDWQRIEAEPDITLLTGREARTIFLGMDQARDVLTHATVKSRNPFKDQRVRAAFAHAINVALLDEKVMGGAAWPAGLLVAPEIQGFAAALNTPYAYDPQRSKALLAAAGYGDGFGITLDCPNNRYVNDERICLAVAAMLAKVGIAVDVLAQPKARYFAKVLSGGGFDTSFFLLGWVPTTFDSHNVLFNLASCRDLERGVGQFNLGGYCNREVDDLTAQIEVETDEARRQDLIERAFSLIRADVGFIPLHQQPVSLAVRRGISVTVRPDNILDLRTVVMP